MPVQNDFYVRKKWPQCAPIINKIQDQSGCGGCWAVASASVFSDRYCIERAKRGLRTDAADASVHASAADTLSCAVGGGCQGGTSWNAWRYFKEKGVVSGTDYDTASGCKPLPFEPFGMKLYNASACRESCTNRKWKNSYKKDKKFAKWIHMLSGPGQVRAIEKELRANGSVVATMTVYEGLLLHRVEHGVYKVRIVIVSYIKQRQWYIKIGRGNHAVRIIGFGTWSCKDGRKQDYWLVANSWNTGWPNDEPTDKGMFRVAKGADECGIESKRVVFGTPAV